MGDPKKQRKKYSTPGHPWQRLRIDEEKELKNEYGFKNKKELWKMNSKLRKFKNQAKDLIARTGAQAEKEKKAMMNKLHALGLIQEDADLSAVLSITLKDIMERRLQTVINRTGLARTMRQARQFITHEHISIGNKRITSPTYLVTKEDEAAIKFHTGSKLSKPEHPERNIQTKKAKGAENDG